jgi:hypothetical protein
MSQQKEFHTTNEEDYDLSTASLVQQLLPHQKRAVQFIERAANSTAKAVLIGDPPGLGKTLPAMIAIPSSVQRETRKIFGCSDTSQLHRMLHRSSVSVGSGNRNSRSLISRTACNIWDRSKRA